MANDSFKVKKSLNIKPNSGSFSLDTISSASDNKYNHFSNCSRVRVSAASEIYKLSLRSTAANTVATCSTFTNNPTGALTGEDSSTKIWANRIR